MDKIELFLTKTSFHGLHYAGDRNASLLKKTLIRVDYFEGSEFLKNVGQKSLKKNIFNSVFLKKYFLNFVQQWKNKTLDETHDGMNITYILNTKSFSNMGPDMFLVEMAGQWKRKQMIPHIVWKGALSKTEKNNQIVVDYLLATTFGVCSWIAPLSKTNDENNEKWPKGSISGAYDAFGHRII